MSVLATALFLSRPTGQRATENSMCSQTAWIVTPEAIKAILLRRVHKPVPCVMCDAQPRHTAAWSRVGKARCHDRGANWKRLADVRADIANEASDIALRVSTLNDVHVCRVVDGSFQLCERGVDHRLSSGISSLAIASSFCLPQRGLSRMTETRSSWTHHLAPSYSVSPSSLQRIPRARSLRDVSSSSPQAAKGLTFGRACCRTCQRSYCA